ncbi:hypothetical protein GCM10011594_03960 [Nakamurella endophytica]|uniref:Bulb-type lectin domain-containing protein n=1 Tax=Nakamurella endophytica TaxID=1748367 RepID=A0A917SLX1_9ACTN|nr:hypothetical protein GCM10011594_03960 [Nakamurella endophytica]
MLAGGALGAPAAAALTPAAATAPAAVPAAAHAAPAADFAAVPVVAPAATPVAQGAAGSTAGAFSALTSSRVLDTRTGIGGTRGLQVAPGSVAVQVLGVGGVPADGVSAVVLTLTVTAATGGGYLAAGADGDPRPDASNLNWAAGQTVANLAVVPVGADGKVRLYTSGRPTDRLHLVADVSGYYRDGDVTEPGGVQVLPSPSRILNTVDGVGAAQAPVAGRGSVTVQVTGRGGIPASGVAAVVVNLTVTRTTGGGHLAAGPAGATPPAVSNLNYPAGGTLANLAVVPLSPDGRMTVWTTGAGTLHLLADVAGYVVAGSTTLTGSVQPVLPARVLDSRTGVGGAGGPLAGTGAVRLKVTGAGGVPASGVSAVALVVTVTAPTSAGYLVAGPDGVAVANASNLNWSPGQTVSNLVLVPVGTNGTVRLTTRAGGTLHLVADVAGFVLSGPPTRALAPGQAISSGSALTSPSGQFSLSMQTDGDLVMTAQGSRLWHSNTDGNPGAVALLQTDGDLVIQSPGGGVLWASGTAGHPWSDLTLGSDGTAALRAGSTVLWSTGSVNSVLMPGRWLQPGWQLWSANRSAYVLMQTDGNLVVRTRLGRLIWQTGTAGHPGAHAVQQNGGNLVVYQGSTPLWYSKTTGNTAARTVLQTDGRLTVVSSAGVPLWWPGKTPATATSGCASIGPDPSGTSITRWNPVTLCVLAALGQSSGNLNDVNTMIRWESGGDPDAVNNWDSNAQNGHPSKGLIQVIQPTFNAYRSALLPDDLLNPAANLYAGLNYAIDTYGSIHNVPGLVSLRNGGGYVGYDEAR